MKKKIAAVTLAVVIGGALTACGSAQESSTDAASSAAESSETGDAQVVYVASPENNYPYSYYDDDGNLTGYDIEVMRAVDEALDDYTFEYVHAEQDAIYTGLSSGKYDIALTNAYYTEERAENYNLPKHQMGASPAGVFVRTENADVKTLSDVASQGLSVAPHLAGDGNSYQVEKYNKENPDNQVEITYSDDPNCFINMIQWVAEGRYDAAFYPKTYFDALVTAEDGDFHQYADQLSYNAYVAVETYPVIAKADTELTDAVDGVLATLKEDGTLEEYAVEYLGFNTFDINSVMDDQNGTSQE